MSCRPARSRAAWSLVLLAAFAPSAVLGCGSSDDAAPPTSQTTSQSTSQPAGSSEPCVPRMPGEILGADEAVVRFSTGLVCPGYVTVAPGTPVTWENEDTVVRTVTVTAGNTADGEVVATGSVAPGETWVETFDTLGVYTYVTDAIPSFRGTVEVTSGGSH